MYAIRSYYDFDEKEISDCGICSICLSKKQPKNTISDIITEIRSLLLQKAATPEELEQHLKIDSSTLIRTLQLLLDQNYITLNSQNQYTIFKWKN